MTRIDRRRLIASIAAATACTAVTASGVEADSQPHQPKDSRIDVETARRAKAEDCKRISRAQLEDLKERLLAPLKRTPRQIGCDTREIDVELFRIFSLADVRPILREKVLTLDGREARPGTNWAEWVYEIPAIWDVEPQEDGTLIYTPILREVPRYTSNTDHALDLKHSVSGLARKLRIEELEDEIIPRWRAMIVDAAGRIAGEGESYDCACAVVIAILSDLIDNADASWWIEVTDAEWGKRKPERVTNDCCSGFIAPRKCNGRTT